MNEADLRAFVREQAEARAVPGVAAAIFLDGKEYYAYHGVTSVENPLPVDENTLFQFGSTGKTFTATAIMRLVEEGRIELDAPVRRYVPEFHLRDEDVAARVTVMHLLNHTAGWDGDMMDDTGNGDDALAQYVGRMARLQQLTPLGSAVSYNNSALSLAGYVLARVTGKTFEQAMEELIFTPLGIKGYFFPNDVMTRRFAVGHNRTPDGEVRVARPWALPRSMHPAGGISSNARDQIAWARFHMGDGRAPDGQRILRSETLRRMQVATADCFGMAIGDQCAITWWLRRVGDLTMVSHGGTTNGQHSLFAMVPARQFAVISLTNCGPNGAELNDALERWALKACLGVEMPEEAAADRPEAELAAYVGRFETIASVCQVRIQGGGLLAQVEPKPEFLAQVHEEAPPPEPPIPLGLIPGGDRYVVTDGPAKGMRGYFRRDGGGRVDAIHLGGRLALRVGDR
jgi:CubicO group peptidase (beta-lactamase class C family)